MNILLLIFDIIFIPITLVRLFLIYLYGSKYGIDVFRFLDVMMHADKKHFNMGSDEINTIGEDYRIVIRDDSRLYPLSDNTIRSDMIMNTNLGTLTSNPLLNDNNTLSDNNVSSEKINTNIDDNSDYVNSDNSENIITGTTNAESKWMLSSEEYLEEKNKDNLEKDVKIIRKGNIDSDSDSSSDSTNNLDSESNNDSDSSSDSDSDSDSDGGEEIIEMMNDISVEEFGDGTNDIKSESQILDSIEKDLRSAIED